MIELLLVGIGTGNPEHVTLQGVRALNHADVILVPRKGEDKADLAELRLQICAQVVTNPSVRIVEFDMPVRDAGASSYLGGVRDWHAATAACWKAAISAADPAPAAVALLVWGDPGLYDSTLRIVELLRNDGLELDVRVIPGISAIQALSAAHAIPLTALGAAFTVTTGRRLREEGWPVSAPDTLVVMLDGECSFQALDPAGVRIWWGAYLGMAGELTIAGRLEECSAQILATRAAARTQNGWIMDIYLLRRGRPGDDQRAEGP